MTRRPRQSTRKLIGQLYECCTAGLHSLIRRAATTAEHAWMERAKGIEASYAAWEERCLSCRGQRGPEFDAARDRGCSGRIRTLGNAPNC
jgi:hypothetical protein